mmetsp:Transcript_666/g.2354  ORF Transcript_666/g.2354 Transcript_666/m.2354 type:complete len:282 (+) Transcript_666:136-981(+)
MAHFAWLGSGADPYSGGRWAKATGRRSWRTASTRSISCSHQRRHSCQRSSCTSSRTSAHCWCTRRCLPPSAGQPSNAGPCRRSSGRQRARGCILRTAVHQKSPHSRPLSGQRSVALSAATSPSRPLPKLRCAAFAVAQLRQAACQAACTWMACMRRAMACPLVKCGLLRCSSAWPSPTLRTRISWVTSHTSPDRTRHWRGLPHARLRWKRRWTPCACMRPTLPWGECVASRGVSALTAAAWRRLRTSAAEWAAHTSRTTSHSTLCSRTARGSCLVSPRTSV